MTAAGKVLLTGATGFVGGELLLRLIKAERPRALVCLVRAESDAAARARGADTLRALLGRRPPAWIAERVEWLRADLEQPGLGLAPATFELLAREVEEVFHCAASTRFDLELEEARRINVEGLKQVYDLAARAAETGRFRRFHHVSTAYVAGKRSARVRASGLPDDRPGLFRNSYERTKAEAERFLRQSTAPVPVTVYRPSIVVGDSRTGRTRNWNVVYHPMRLMASGRLGFVSRGGASLLDCVPVDYVVDAIAALSRREDTAGQTFHLTAGDDALNVHDVIRHTYEGVARRDGTPVRIRTRALGPVAWWAFTRTWRALAAPRIKRAIDGFSAYVDYTRCETRFDDMAERALLAREGVVCPPSAEFFPRLVDYALARNFGRPQRTRAGERRAPVGSSGRLLAERLALTSGMGPVAA